MTFILLYAQFYICTLVAKINKKTMDIENKSKFTANKMKFKQNVHVCFENQLTAK